jgi:hypothetical protein
MDKEWNDKWVAALRSGDYKQCKFDLSNKHNEYCCLGVLCDIVSNVKPVDGYWTDLLNYERDLGFIPKSVGETTGFTNNKDHHTLVKMNDDQKKTFNQIADYIEEHF